MGSLRDELVKYQQGTNLCSVGKLLEKLDKQTADELREIVADDSVTLNALSRLSHAKGWRIHRDTFSNHRQGGCRCVTQR
jgi:hypothetical protein